MGKTALQPRHASPHDHYGTSSHSRTLVPQPRLEGKILDKLFFFLIIIGNKGLRKMRRRGYFCQFIIIFTLAISSYYFNVLCYLPSIYCDWEGCGFIA